MKFTKNLFSYSSESNFTFSVFHRLLGATYIIAALPLLFQILPLIGENGLLPAGELLKTSYKDQGYFLSFMQFPSFFHFIPSDYTLLVLIVLCALSGFLLLINRFSFFASFVAWFSFLSITTIGGDFFIIIIDLFLSEVGFLAIFSTYFLSKYRKIPKIILFTFKFLNFKLWFCMGVNKFYMPLEVWKKLTFFDYFFYAQPMPTPLAPIFNLTPDFLKKTAIVGLFVAEIIVPFFVFGNKNFRRTAFTVFFVTSILIQLTGNYGYFNLLSIVLLFTLLRDSDLPSRRYSSGYSNNNDIKLNRFVKGIFLFHIAFQFFQCVYIFKLTQHSYQNHFNHFFNQIDSDSKTVNILLKPFQWIEYWRICNPYGVFKGIPYYHGEIRLSGSYDGENWQTYQFRHVPSAYTDYLGFYAPYYPRLDHLMFYETLGAQNYRWNLLNPYYNENNSWICRFIDKLLENDKNISHLLKKNPFLNNSAPLFIKADIYQLEFSKEPNKNWNGKSMNIQKIFSKEKVCDGYIISYEEASKTTYSKGE